ncbi:glycosyltransferase family 2 protein [soil metagenome]
MTIELAYSSKDASKHARPDASQPDVKHDILVVIPTLNEINTIEGVVHSLTRKLPDTSTVTFVVVDGGSTDGTVELVQSLSKANSLLRLLQLHVLSNPKRIQSAAVNMAVRHFGDSADILVRCDAHAEYPAGYIASLVDSLDRMQADAVVVPMDSEGATPFQRAVAWASNSFVGTGGSAHRGGSRSGFVDHGHHAAFRMASFQEAGGYDSTFTHNEDAELDCRQVRLGKRVYLDADIRIVYRPRATVASLARQYFAYGKGRSRTVRKHPHSMRARQLAIPLHLIVSALCIAGAAWMPWLLLWPLSYLVVLNAVSIQIARQKRSWDGLLAGLAAATMHLSWGAGFLTGLLTLREKPWQPPPAAASQSHADMGTAR